MGLDLGNLLGAVTNATTAFSKETGVKAFLGTFKEYGAQVKNNFEVNFSGLQGMTFFITNISVPGMTQNMTTLNYNGRVVDIPINFDFEHDFQITVRNDAQGYIYSALHNFVMENAGKVLANSGYTITIKALTGDTKHYKGALVTLEGVRLTQVSGLDWGHDDNSIQTFTVNGKAQSMTYTAGAVQKAAGILGAVTSILK
jgi:hypothetical protein